MITNTIRCVKGSNKINKYVDLAKDPLDEPELNLSNDYTRIRLYRE